MNNETTVSLECGKVKKTRIVLRLMLFLLAVTTVHASAANENSFANVQKDVQQSKITGIVKAQNGEPLPGATVQVKGTTNGTVTDIDGHFSISAAGTVTLTISYVGYENPLCI
jgi:hypothetical protein